MASYARSVGWDLKLLERYEEGEWVRDGLYRAMSLAQKYYSQHEQPAPEDVLLVLIAEKLEPKYVQEAAAAVGDLCGIEPPKRPDIAHAVRKLVEHRSWREFEAETTSIREAVISGTKSIEEAIESCQVKLRHIRQWSHSSRAVREGQAYVDFLDEGPVQVASPAAEGTAGKMPIGLPAFDEHTDGMAPGDLLFLQGRMNVGKTMVSHAIARKWASTGANIVIFSAEMSVKRNLTRMAGALLNTDYRTFNRPDLDKAYRYLLSLKLREALEGYGKMLVVGPLYCADMGSIREVLLEITRQDPIHGIVIDYLEEVEPSVPTGGWAEPRILGRVVSEVKALSEEFGVRTVLVGQTNRDSIRRGASTENTAGTDKPLRIADFGIELRHNQEDLERIANEEDSSALPTCREIRATCIKDRDGGVGFSDVLDMNFSTGNFKPYVPSTPVDVWDDLEAM